MSRLALYGVSEIPVSLRRIEGAEGLEWYPESFPYVEQE